MAVTHYKLALKSNSENFEAFDRLIANYLLPHQDSIYIVNIYYIELHLIDEVKFAPENMWLKDYYSSRIEEVYIHIYIYKYINSRILKYNIGIGFSWKSRS